MAKCVAELVSLALKISRRLRGGVQPSDDIDDRLLAAARCVLALSQASCGTRAHPSMQSQTACALLPRPTLSHASQPQPPEWFVDLEGLVHGREEGALKQEVLGGLGAQIGVGRLLLDEDTANLAQLRVHARHLELNVAVQHLELLVVLLEHLVVTASLHGREGDGLIVASGGATTLGVEEETGAVRRHLEATRKLEARVDRGGRHVRLRDQVLDREEEGDALATGQLDRGGRIVDAVLLDERELAGIRHEVTLNAGEHVRLASRHLGVDRLGDEALLGQLLLENLEAGRLEAELVDLVLLAAGQLDRVAARALNLRAGVGEASALDLLVRQRRDLRAGEGARRCTLHAGRKRKRGSEARRLPGLLTLLGHLGSGSTRRDGMALEGRAAKEGRRRRLKSEGGSEHGDDQ